jgi:hypothetical protein
MLTNLTVVLGGVMLGGAGMPGAEAQTEGEAVSYEALAAAEGVRFSVSAPGFAAVETFIDGGGPVSQAIIDGLGNSRAFASLPYPGDLAISGPGLLAGLTGLPSPPPYPFYVDSSYPTEEESKLTQPGYELIAKSAEQTSEASTSTGGTSGESAIGSTRTRALTTRDPATGAVTAEATGTADVVNIGGVLRIGQASAVAKVTRAPGAEPVRESGFAVNGLMIAGQTVGISEKGLTFGGSTTPLPAGNPLGEVLTQAKITVTYVVATNTADGVVSPGLVITQEQQIPGGPTMVMRYIFGRMSAYATVSGSPTSIGSKLPVETGPIEGPTFEGPPEQVAPPVEPVPDLAAPVTTDLSTPVLDTGTFEDSGGFDAAVGESGYGSGSDAQAGAGAGVAAPVPGTATQVASPIAGESTLRTDTLSIYLILVIGAAVTLGGGFLLRFVGVKLAWTR